MEDFMLPVQLGFLILFGIVFRTRVLLSFIPMGLDIVLFRKDQGGDPDLVIESQKRRYKGPETVQAVIDADAKWRKGGFFACF